MRSLTCPGRSGCRCFGQRPCMHLGPRTSPGYRPQLAICEDASLDKFDLGTGLAEVGLPVVTSKGAGEDAGEKSKGDIERRHGG